MIKVALVGFGGIAQIHRYAYWLLSGRGVPVQLIAACDRDPGKFLVKTKTNLALEDFDNETPFNQYTDLEEMLANEKPDLIDICLPTKFHASMTIDLLNRGYNVLCEKPMSSTFEECVAMLEAEKNSTGRLMIGQCLRFYPEYEYLQKLVVNKTYGDVIESEFYRYSPPPFWSNDNWQLNAKQSGGCLGELGIHDVDYVRWLFGEPQKLSCRIESRVSEDDFTESILTYPTHSSKVLNAWLTPEDVFVHGYEVKFTNAIVKMRAGKVTVTENGKAETQVDITNYDGIIGEIEYLIEVLTGKHENTKNPPEGSARTVWTLERLRESSNTNSEIIIKE